jgi:N-acetylmuramoyl-L-alanine amidase
VETTLRPGDAGPAVVQVVSLLHRLGLLETQDGVTGPSSYDRDVELAVRAFQQQRGLTVDGLVGPSTFRRLDEARWRLGDRILVHRPGSPVAGDDVYALQSRLLDLGFTVGRLDGYFGSETEAGVREFQRNFGIPPDGTCGPATLKALARLRPLVSGGAPNTMRAEEWIRESGPHLGGKTVVVDVTASDPILHDLAARIEGRLVAIGVQAYLTAPRWAEHPREESERAAFANRAGADLVVSLALDASENPDACGVAAYFFGDADPQTWSSAGERLAGLVQREVVARTGATDLRCHPKTWDLLRRTRMPAVHLDAGYRTHAGDLARLEDPAHRDVLAAAVVVAVQRFYLSPDVDAVTGVLDVGELRESFGRA